LMQADRTPWQDHYQGTSKHITLMCHFGYADRIRYFWNHPKAVSVVKNLRKQINTAKIPEPLLRQYFSTPVLSRADQLQSGRLTCADALIVASVQEALEPYFFDAAHED